MRDPVETVGRVVETSVDVAGRLPEIVGVAIEDGPEIAIKTVETVVEGVLGFFGLD